MLEVEPSGHRGRIVTRSDQNIFEAEKLMSSVSKKIQWDRAMVTSKCE